MRDVAGAERPVGPSARAVWQQALAAIVVLAVGPVARADGLQEFERARRAYERQNYATAAERFERLVGGEVSRLRSKPLVLESRKYLAASYLFLGQRDKAKKQFQRLLRADEDYTLDPAAFPSEVHEVFHEARKALEKEQAQRQRERRAQRQQRLEQRQARWKTQQERFERLQRLAATEAVEQHNSRWLALLPFGVGQFQNEHWRAGLAFALSESALAVASLISFALHRSVANERGSADVDQARAERLEKAFRLTNWVSSGLLAAVAIGGIVDAQVRFRPVIRKTRQRTLPEELQAPPEPPPGLELSLGPLGGGLQLRF